MAYVEVDVDIDVFDDDDLIDEIRRRWSRNKKDFKKRLTEEIKEKLDESGIYLSPYVKRIVDKMKLMYFLENFGKISIEDLEKITKK